MDKMPGPYKLSYFYPENGNDTVILMRWSKFSKALTVIAGTQQNNQDVS